MLLVVLAVVFWLLRLWRLRHFYKTHVVKLVCSASWLQAVMASTKAGMGHDSHNKSIVEPSARLQVCSVYLRGHVTPGPQIASSPQRKKITACQDRLLWMSANK
jgi:hypothetical protein